jgi:hypothetical protein
MKIEIVNAKNTAGLKETRRFPDGTKCSVVGCPTTEVDVSHIHKVILNERGGKVADEDHMYLVPLCHYHNMQVFNEETKTYPILTIEDSTIPPLE